MVLSLLPMFHLTTNLGRPKRLGMIETVDDMPLKIVSARTYLLRVPVPALRVTRKAYSTLGTYSPQRW